MTRQLPEWARDVARRLLPVSAVVVDGLWANPPGALIDRIYEEAKKVFPRTQGCADPTMPAHQSWLRKVHVEFHRRLKAAGVYVEGGAE